MLGSIYKGELTGLSKVRHALGMSESRSSGHSDNLNPQQGSYKKARDSFRVRVT